MSQNVVHRNADGTWPSTAHLIDQSRAAQATIAEYAAERRLRRIVKTAAAVGAAAITAGLLIIGNIGKHEENRYEPPNLQDNVHGRGMSEQPAHFEPYQQMDAQQANPNAVPTPPEADLAVAVRPVSLEA